MAAMGDVRLYWWTLTAALAILVASSGAAGVEGVCSRMHYAYAYFLSTLGVIVILAAFFLLSKIQWLLCPRPAWGKRLT